MKRGNWTDAPCFYVAAVSGARTAVVAGPVISHQEALDLVEPAKTVGLKLDPASASYTWGTCQRINGYREGSLNKHLNI